ncbi:MAG: isochorismate synthase [Actinomycetota bacterium]|nr:isochorismate synthase [Actinomycetota bacterium]MDA3007073.1 isochorismate synthase [Actinomycetota bacterium]MDA3034312.1 isochorismate synthase [Actinomycetota bacterium]
MTTSAARLISTTFDLADHPLGAASLVDIAAGDGLLFATPDHGLAAWGVTATTTVIAAHDTLAGTDGVAIGAIGFRPADDQLTIPEVTVRSDSEGHRSLIVVRAHNDPRGLPTTIDEAIDGRGIANAPNPATNGYRIRAMVDTEKYLAAVTAARDAVRAGDIDKAVIARPVEISTDEPIDVHAVLRRLETTFPNTYRFSANGFIGASPELLVEVRGDIVRSRPLAGTTRTTGDDARDAALAAELLASEKNRVEHRAAMEMVRDTLLPHCSYLDWTPEPDIVKVANVQHLASFAEGRLSSTDTRVGDLLLELQPTPAVGGHPRDAALELIEAVEGFTRGLYGGAVGWIDAAGDGVWAVSLRCAELSDDRRRARVVAGGGIVADSEPRAELAETQAKMQAMLAALVRP